MDYIQKVNIAVIGVGYWGPNLVRNFFEIPEVGRVFVYDLDFKRLELMKQKFPQVEIASSIENILNNPEIHAVSVATPVNKHFEVVEKCLRAGKHVIVEKPLAQSSRECEELIRIAKENNRKLMVGHIMEYKPAIREIKNYIERGELGDILYIDASRLNLGLIRGDVSVLWDAAVHDIYTLNYILGKRPISVSAIGEKYSKHTGVNLESLAYLVLNYGDGLLAHVHLNWLSPIKKREMMICGSKKMLTFDDVSLTEPIRIYDRGVEPKNERINFPDLNYRVGDTLIPRIKMDEPLRTECEHFIDCVMNNKEPQSDGIAGLITVKVLETAEKSLKANSQFIYIDYGKL